ncbi:MAG: HEAT repeat domain-containing protein [Polyangiales bacterium]
MSLLSALLTQDQVVSPKAIDEAISRQVINGGDFETSLLEGGAIGEDTLARYCAAVHGLPHATREDVAEADPVAIARLPRALAERHRMAALFIDAGRLIVAVAAPVEPAARAEVEATVKLPLEARCVTSVRLAWALWRYYQLPLPPRFERLAGRLSTVPPGPIPAEVIVPLVRPRNGARTSTPALDAFAALDAMLNDDDDDGSSSQPPPSEPAPPPGLRRSAPEIVRPSVEPARVEPVRVEPARVEPAVNPMAFNLPTTTPPFGTPSVPPPERPAEKPVVEARTSAPAIEPRTSSPALEAQTPAPVVEARATAPSVEVRISAASVEPRASAPAIARPASPPPPMGFPTDPPPATRPAILPAPSVAARAVPSQRSPEAPERAPVPAAISAAPTSAPESLPPTPLLPGEPRLPRGVIASMPPPAIEVLLEGGDGLLHDVRLSSLPPPPRGISLDDALRRLDAAHDRDAVVDAMLAHVHERFAYAALFVVQGAQGAGVAALGEGALGAALRGVSFELERPSTFRLAFESGAVEVARVEPDTLDAEVRARLQRPVAEEVVVAPVRIGAKVALLLWADNGRRAPTALAVRELDAFIKRCAAAFERLIAARKRPNRASQPQITLATSARPVERAPLPDRSARLHALRGALSSDAPAPATSAPPPLWSDRPVEPEVGREAPPPGLKATPVRAPGDVCASVVRELLEGSSPVPGALDTLLAHGDAGLDALLRAFPGPHRPRRAEPGARAAALDEGAPLLRAVVAFRQAAAPRLVKALDDVDPDVRYCAVACLGECAHPSAIAPLVARLFDDDDAVRAAAVDALRAHQRFEEFEGAGRAVRASLSDPRAAARRAAAAALSELRDAEAVPALVAALGDADAGVVEAAHRALTVITRQDFGAMAAPWVTWWGRSGQQHRVVWLIDALLHPEPAVRHEASEELKRLTGQYFGYYFNLPKRDRERAHQRYVEWWKGDGAQRFESRNG